MKKFRHADVMIVDLTKEQLDKLLDDLEIAEDMGDTYLDHVATLEHKPGKYLINLVYRNTEKKITALNAAIRKKTYIVLWANVYGLSKDQIYFNWF